MTVKELIEHLSDLDQEAEVLVLSDEEGNEIRSARTIEYGYGMSFGASGRHGYIDWTVSPEPEEGFQKIVAFVP